jgi:hypothetical protein
MLIACILEAGGQTLGNQAARFCAGPKVGSRSHVPLLCQAQFLGQHQCQPPDAEGYGAFLVTVEGA